VTSRPHASDPAAAPDLEVRSRAATEWTAWEDAVISQESNGSPGAYGDRADDVKLAFVRVCHTGSASMTDEADAAADRLYRRITQPA